jgi:hypothetical protein
MKFIIDRETKNSYSEELLIEYTHDFKRIEDEERRKRNELQYISDDVVEGWIDDEGICHRINRETYHFIDVNTIEELFYITKENGGRIVFDTYERQGVLGKIEIYDDYRE